MKGWAVILWQRIVFRAESLMPILRKWPSKVLPLLLLLPGNAYPLLASRPSQSHTQSPPGDSLETHLGKGYEALKQEKYEEAEKEFRSALAIDPSMTLRARFPLAVALFEQHKSADARREFEAVRHANGDQPGVLYYLGRIDLEEQNFKGAVANLAKASGQPPFPDNAFYLGLAYLKLGSNQNAEKWLKKATELNPADSRALYELAKLYRKGGREEEAKQAFQRSKEIKTQSDKLSQLKYACGQELDHGPNGPAPSCDRLFDPNDADQLTTLGILYGQHGLLGKSLKPLERAAELAPQSPQIQYNLAFTYYQLQRFEEARKSLEPAAQRWPDLFPVSALYGAVLWNLGDPKAAYETLVHAHQLNPQDASATALLYQSTLELASQEEKAGSDSQAIRYLQEAAGLVPADPEPHQQLAAIYRRTGQPEKANHEEQKAAALAKSSNK
jgi:tetratricopeptide (TPR) repeat protein